MKGPSMSEPTSTAANEPQLTAEVSTTGSPSRISNVIAPEHQHHADAILAMDPLAVPRTHDIPDGWAANLTMRATALPPEMQREVMDKLAALGNLTPEQRQAKEAEFTADAIRSQRSSLMVKIGVGRDATPYHQELLGIAREVEDNNRQIDALQAELDRVARYGTVTDPVTGEIKPVPVYAVTGERERAYKAQQVDLHRRIRLLVNDNGTPGIEGAKRAHQALAESVAALVERDRQVTEEAAAKLLAAKDARDERIRKRADSIVRLNRNDF